MVNRIVILDFGSQYTKLIARRVRELHVYSEILPHDVAVEALRSPDIKGIILSGGPRSVLGADSLHTSAGFWDLQVPMLGICYGQQLMCLELGGVVENALDREYGPATLDLEADDHPLFGGFEKHTRVWMSHGDRLIKEPPGFRVIGSSENAPITAMVHETLPRLGIQFHPEVSHTENGMRLLSNFVFNICGSSADWQMTDYIAHTVAEIKATVGDERVLLGLSGGVDSTVAAALISKAIGKQLTCVYVDHGMMRKGETDDVVVNFRQKFDVELVSVDASELFLTRLAGVSDPEKKRKIIGATFIEVFDAEAAKLDKPKFLAQGTLYPDVIESAHTNGPAQTIKSHHNVGGLPERMNMTLLEPLRELFKDEVREVGRILGVPERIVGRHPFPGPGLAVRILGEIDRDAVKVLQEADHIFVEMLHEHGLYHQTSQAFVVLLPVRTVGIMGDERTYDKVCAIRAVTTSDFMTADWCRLPYDFLALVSSRIVNEVAGINRVVMDITSKPPGTIEWE